MATFFKLKVKKTPIVFVQEQVYLANRLGRWETVRCIRFEGEGDNKHKPILRPVGSDLGYSLDWYDAVCELIYDKEFL